MRDAIQPSDPPVGSGATQRDAETTQGRAARRWHAGFERHAVHLAPGDLYATAADELIATLLGSCVSACIRDPEAQVGGMNHFLIPIDESAPHHSWQDSAAGRYGSSAMETLINEILERGGRRDRLEVKLFGGGRILEGLTDIGQQNTAFVLEYLRMEGLHIVAHDLGGGLPRKVQYFPRSGRARVKKLRALELDRVALQERALLRALRQKPVHSDVELF